MITERMQQLAGVEISESALQDEIDKLEFNGPLFKKFVNGLEKLKGVRHVDWSDMNSVSGGVYVHVEWVEVHPSHVKQKSALDSIYAIKVNRDDYMARDEFKKNLLAYLKSAKIDCKVVAPKFSHQRDRYDNKKEIIEKYSRAYAIEIYK